jgi:hypothetical protein
MRDTHLGADGQVHVRLRLRVDARAQRRVAHRVDGVAGMRLRASTPPTVNGDTLRSFSTHGQQSAAKGSSTIASRADIRLIKHLDSLALGLVRRWLSIGYFPIQLPSTQTLRAARAATDTVAVEQLEHDCPSGVVAVARGAVRGGGGPAGGGALPAAPPLPAALPPRAFALQHGPRASAAHRGVAPSPLEP